MADFPPFDQAKQVLKQTKPEEDAVPEEIELMTHAGLAAWALRTTSHELDAIVAAQLVELAERLDAGELVIVPSDAVEPGVAYDRIFLP